MNRKRTEYFRAYRSKNREKFIEYQKRWIQKVGREQYSLMRKKWRENYMAKHKQKAVERVRNYRKRLAEVRYLKEPLVSEEEEHVFWPAREETLS